MKHSSIVTEGSGDCLVLTQQRFKLRSTEERSLLDLLKENNTPVNIHWTVCSAMSLPPMKPGTPRQQVHRLQIETSGQGMK